MRTGAARLACVEATWLLVPALLAAGCSTSTPARQSRVCPPGDRFPLLTATLSRLVPADGFVVGTGAAAWVATTEPGENGGLMKARKSAGSGVSTGIAGE